MSLQFRATVIRTPKPGAADERAREKLIRALTTMLERALGRGIVPSSLFSYAAAECYTYLCTLRAPRAPIGRDLFLVRRCSPHPVRRPLTILAWIAAVPVALVIVALLLSGAEAIYWRFHPIAEFEHRTERPLPPGFLIARSASAMNDNVFRSTFYWTLEVPEDGFHRLIENTGFQSSIDARDAYFHEIQTELAPTLVATDIAAAYQWSREQRRSQIILRHRDGHTAYYVLSTL